MMDKKLLLILIFICLIFTGCNNSQVAESLSLEVEKLNEVIESKDTKISELQSQLLDQGVRISMIEGELSNIAYLDPSSTGYAKSGIFLVMISKVEEYLDGCKVYLTIGNPDYATYKGFTINARYGTRLDFTNTNFNYDEWNNNLKEKDTDLTNTLERGTWNNVEIMLPSISTKDFSYLEVKILTDIVSLNNK